MTTLISLLLAVEDDLTEQVARRVLAGWPRIVPGPVYSRGGYGYLKKNVLGFNNAAKACPVLLLTDLDQYDCAPALIGEWLGVPAHPDFLLRVAVREVESWLLGDSQALRRYFGLRSTKPLPPPESLPDPKDTMLRLALRARRREVREAIVWQDPKTGRLAYGPDYNGTLGRFAAQEWDVAIAAKACPSLARLLVALDRLVARRP